jgi:hypothetical protein
MLQLHSTTWVTQTLQVGLAADHASDYREEETSSSSTTSPYLALTTGTGQGGNHNDTTSTTKAGGRDGGAEASAREVVGVSTWCLCTEMLS